MFHMSTTSRAGATALAATIATALTTAGGAGADVPQLPIVDAAVQDVANVTAAVQPVVADVAPNTTAAVSSTVHQVAAGVDGTVHSVRDTASHTVKATKFVAQDVTTQAGSLTRDTADNASHVVRSTGRTASRVTHSAASTTSHVARDTSKTTSRVLSSAKAFTRSGSIVVAKPVMNGWQLRWAGSDAGCTTLDNKAPELLLLQPFRIGIVSEGHTTSIAQQDMNSSLDLSC
jgi:hypothetical protein